MHLDTLLVEIKPFNAICFEILSRPPGQYCYDIRITVYISEFKALLRKPG
jgi:hypothetical protein